MASIALYFLAPYISFIDKFVLIIPLHIPKEQEQHPTMFFFLYLLITFVWSTLFAWFYRSVVRLTKEGSEAEETVANLLFLPGLFFVVFPYLNILTHSIANAAASGGFSRLFYGFLIVLLTLTVLAIYFIPSMVAEHRGHHNCLAITVTNFLLGWTIIERMGSGLDLCLS